MPTGSLSGELTVVVVVTSVAFLAEVVLCVGPQGLTLNLERAFPSNHGVELSQLRDRDRFRHGRVLQSLAGVAAFPVAGTYNPYDVGLYYARVQLGSPPKEFYVQIDTGSDALWVSCNSCNGCPASSGLHIQLDFYDPSSSSTASLISCSDKRCAVATLSSDSACSAQNNQCGYTFQYGDGSGTSGYYVSDLMQFDTIVGNSSIKSSANVVFGCSTSQKGDLRKSDKAVDGIFGFGQQGLSIISQLSSQGVTPDVFSHCLKGNDNGGGTLVLGQIMEPNMVYSPLVSDQPHYNLNLLSISVNGHILPIDPSVFQTSNNQGTIIDSGTTLAYLADEAYDPFVNAVTEIVSQSVRLLHSKGNQCYLITYSVSEIFPPVSLNFAGGASMILKPEDYLINQNSADGGNIWCIGFQKMQGQRVTILGDLILKDKIIVYDLGGQRIGWASYDCSSSINVSSRTSSGRREFINARTLSNNSSSKKPLVDLITGCLLVFFMHLSVMWNFFLW